MYFKGKQKEGKDRVDRNRGQSRTEEKSEGQKRRTRAAFAVGGLCVLFLLGLVFGGVLSVRKNTGEGKGGENCVAEIVTPLHRGQGVVFASDPSPDKTGQAWFLVTAGHVAEGMQTGEPAQIRTREGQTGDARLLYHSETADLAFFYVGEAAIQGIECVDRDRSALDAAAAGDRVYARYLVRNGETLEEKVMQGTLLETWVYLEDFDLYMMLAELPAESGMSGCGFFDEQGKFLGILCGVSAQKEAAVLPLSIIESEWLLQDFLAE